MSLGPEALAELRDIEEAGYSRRSERAYAIMRNAVGSRDDLATLVNLFAASPSHDIIGGLIRTIRDNEANIAVDESFQLLLAVAKEFQGISGTPHHCPPGMWHRGTVETLIGSIVEFWPLETAETYPLETLRPLLDAWVHKLRGYVTSSDVDLIEDLLLGAAVRGTFVLARCVSETVRTAIIGWIRNPPDNGRAYIRELDPSESEKERTVLDALLAMQPASQ